MTMDDGSQLVYVKRLKIVLLISSIVSLVFLLMSAFQENMASDWKEYQKEYREVLVNNAQSEQAKQSAQRTPIGFKQTFLPKLDRIDRCVTCHVGIEDPRQSEADQPLRLHSGDILKNHPVDKFGCTVCHDGQGRAVSEIAGHGEIEFWPEPLLRGEEVYRSCGGCHYENDLYGAEYDLFTKSEDTVFPDLRAAELKTAVPGIKSPSELAIGRGKRLVLEKGCLGCHTYRNRGGKLGPDITYVGDKVAHDFDFTYLKDSTPFTVKAWLTAHFKDPRQVVPGTLMPEMDLTEDDASDLAEYMLSLQEKDAPASYTPVPTLLDSAPASGQRLFAMFCSSCHGDSGQGSSVLDPDLRMLAEPPHELMTPAIHNDDTLAVASDDYFRSIITHGRRDTNMIAWDRTDGGLSNGEIDRLVGYIRDWQKPGAPLGGVSSARGDASRGQSLYRSRCMGCHGRKGEGGIGVALDSATFLDIASDEFLAASIIHGRPNTAMPAWKQLSVDEVDDLLAFIRGWQAQPPDKQAVLSQLAKSYPTGDKSLKIGKSLFNNNCAACHGRSGEGTIGPSLNSNAFLSVVDDNYLYEAIVNGRPGTAMPGWKHLSAEDVIDLIGYIRSWNNGNRVELAPYIASGDWDYGKILFEGTCASCHGREAEGATGPQLRNPVFMRTVSDAMLREWITKGKNGTEMRAFGRGHEGISDFKASQIEDIISYLRRFEYSSNDVVSRPGMGIAANGKSIYEGLCASCHGLKGEGLTGSALSNPKFLKYASDGYLMATITLGRTGTEMRAMGEGMQGYVQLSADNITDVVAYIRNWEHKSPIEGLPERYVSGTDLLAGATMYNGFCASCHGKDGNNGWAPQLNNADFLSAVTDGFLQATIVRGRIDTPMRPFGIGGGGVAELSTEDINNIVGFIRQWAPEEFKPSDKPVDDGFDDEDDDF